MMMSKRAEAVAKGVRAGLLAGILWLPAPASAAPDAATGATIFKRTCAACHSLKPGQNRVGPSLAAVYGRPLGKQVGYNSSPALAAAKGAWDDKRLDAWLKDPRGLFAGARMFTQVNAPDERAALIAYLKTKPVS